MRYFVKIKCIHTSYILWWYGVICMVDTANSECQFSSPGLIWGPIWIFNVKPVSQPFYYIVINILVTSSEILWKFWNFELLIFWIKIVVTLWNPDRRVLFPLSPRFLCRPTALYILLEPWDVRAIHTENSGFASPTLGQHISTFRGYRILFSIRNLNINRFTNHFSIHS